jgi:hypothetical protein
MSSIGVPNLTVTDIVCGQHEWAIICRGHRVRKTVAYEAQSPTELNELPVRRYVADPVDAGGLHGDGGVEAFGDGLGDEGLALLLEEGDEALFLLDQGVDGRRGLAVEEVGDGALKHTTACLTTSGANMRNQGRGDPCSDK